MHLVGALARQIVTCCGLCGTRATTAPNALSSGTKETFHTVKVPNVRAHRLLSLVALAIVDFLVGRWLLQVAAIVSEARLVRVTPGSIRLEGLHLSFEGIVDTLTLVYRMI